MSRKWLVGIGLAALLLLLAVPTLAQNDWAKQSAPPSFATPVQTVTFDPSGSNYLSAGTYGGGYPGGNGGYENYSTDGGATFAQYAATPCPPWGGPGDDWTDSMWDGITGWGFGATWNSGLYVYPFPPGPATNPSCGVSWVNQHVTSLGLDTGTAGVGIPHVLYFGTWGGGIYSYDGATFLQVYDPLTTMVNGVAATPAMFFIHDIVVVPNACAGTYPLVLAATDGAGILRGTWCGGAWTWTTVNTGLTDLYVYSLAYGSGTFFAGTQGAGIFWGTGTSWTAMASSSAINTPVDDILFVGYPNMVFAATDGQGVYRYSNWFNKWVQINNGWSTSLGDLWAHALAYDPGSMTLWAGTGNGAGAGNVWRIALTPFTGTFTPTSPTTVGATINDTVGGITANNAPSPWQVDITGGSLPPGLAEGVNNSPYPPVVSVSGSPTADGCYTATMSVWDALYNRTDFAANYTVNPLVAASVAPSANEPFGTVMVFTSTVTGATGTVTYLWDFDSTGVSVPAGTWTSTMANPTFIYPVAGSYVVSLTVTDTNATGPCTVGNVVTLNVTVFGPLTANPTATIVGSGAQFQFMANASGGDTSCSPPAPSPYTYSWEFKDKNTSAVLFTSTLANPVITFAYTGDFLGEVTVTDCSGHTVTGTVSVNWNGQMAATLASNCNPAPSGVPGVQFTATASSASMPVGPPTVTWDMGDGSPPVGPIPLVGPPTPPYVFNFAWIYGPVCPSADYTVTATITDAAVPLHTTIVSMVQHIYSPFTAVMGNATPDPVGTGCQLTTDQPLSITLQPTGIPGCPQGGQKPFVYSIDWGDGFTTTQTFDDYNVHNFSHSYAAGGPYTVTAYVTDSGNCPIVTQNWVYGPFTVVAPLTSTSDPTANTLRCLQTGLGVQFLDGTAITFATTPSGGSGTYSYYWQFDSTGVYWNPASQTSTAASPTFTYPWPFGNGPWTFTVKVTVTDTLSCKPASVTNTIVVTIYRNLLLSTPTWAQGCGNRTVTFNAGHSALVTRGIPPYVVYVWNYDDGFTETTANPWATHTYAANGGYDVQLTVTDSAVPMCVNPPNTVNVNWHIDVVEPIVVAASSSPNVGCVPFSQWLSPTGTSGGGMLPGPLTNLTYLWHVSPGAGWTWSSGNATSANPQITFNTAGTYTIWLTVTSGLVPTYTCNSTSFQVVASNPVSAFGIVPTSTSDLLPLDDTFTTTWMGGSAPFTLVYTMTRIKDKNGVPVGDAPILQTINNATSPYQFTYTFLKTGTWTVTCAITDNCATTQSNMVTLQVLEPPALDVTTTSLVNGVAGNAGTTPLTVVFGCVPSGGVSPYTYLWNFNDGSPTTTAQNPTHVFTSAGTYDVTVVVTDSWPAPDGGPTTKTAHITIIVYNPVTSTLTASPNAVQTGVNVTFTATAAGGNGTYNYQINYGDGVVENFGPVASATHVFTHGYSIAKPSGYSAMVTVTDTATNSGQSNPVIVNVFDPVSVTLSATPNQGTDPLSVTFTANATGGDGSYTFGWDFNNDGIVDATTSQGTINHVYTSAFSGNAKVTVTDGETPPQSAIATTPITIWDPLTISINATTATEGDIGMNVGFNATVVGGDGSYTYTWYFGDGATGATMTPNHTYNTAGQYFAYCVVTDGSSHSATSSSIPITVYAPLTVSLSGTPTSGTLPLPVTFSAVAAGGDGHYTYSYHYGDGASGSNPNHSYAAAGTYNATVTVTDTASHSTTSNTVTITVWAPLTATIASSGTTGTTPYVVNFTSTVAGGDGNYTYAWNFGDGSTSGAANPAHTFNNAGVFSVTLTVTDTASHTVISNTINMTVYAPLAVSLSGTPTSGTLPLSVTFAATATGGDGHYTYSYTYGDGGSGSNPNHTYATAGTYNATVTVTDTASHNATSNTVTITVWAPLTASIASSGTTGTTPYAVTFTSTVTGGDGSYSYMWNFGDGSTSTAANPNHTYSSAGNFSVTLTVHDGSSHSDVSNTINMTVYAPLTVSASGTPSSLIVGNSVTFTAVAGGGDGHYSYAWDFGDGTNGTGATANHVYSTYDPSDFTYMAHVTVTDTASHSVTSADIAIIVKPVPPTINYAKKQSNPFRIVLFGNNFQSAITATINGTPVTVKFKNGGKIKLKNCKALCPKGVPVDIVLTNPDGGVSAPFQFTR